MKRTLLCAFCCFIAANAMAIEPVDGVYQIGSAQDWAEFCTLHNEGTDQRLNAVLTADITVEGDSLLVRGSFGNTLRGGKVSSHGDHHLAMALLAAGKICDGKVLLDDAACIDRSWPDFPLK